MAAKIAHLTKNSRPDRTDPPERFRRSETSLSMTTTDSLPLELPRRPAVGMMLGALIVYELHCRIGNSKCCTPAHSQRGSFFASKNWRLVNLGFLHLVSP